MNLKPIIEKAIIRGELLADDERAYLLDWFTRAEGMADRSNLVTGQTTIPIGPTQYEINTMVDQALRSRQVVNNLAEISSQTGLQVAGEFRVGNGKLPGDGFTGGRFGYPGFTYGSVEYILAGVENDVLQVGISLADGKLYAGAGAVVLDDTGINAIGGTIGGWTIDGNQIYSSEIAGVILDSSDEVILVGNTASTHLQIDGANQRIRSSNFVTGSAGFNIAADTGDAEFNNITARGELKTFLLTSSNQMAVGGNIIVSKDAGKLGADVTAIATTVNFGKAMTVGDWIKIQGPDSAGSNALEAMLVGSNVSGFTYNVTRNVDGSGANAWLKDTPFVVIGASGDSRIEMVAGASAGIQLITQGAAYGTTTVQTSMSTVDGAITAGAGAIALDSNGITSYVDTSPSDNSSYKFVNSDPLIGALGGLSAYQPDIDNLFTIFDISNPAGDNSVFSISTRAVAYGRVALAASNETTDIAATIDLYSDSGGGGHRVTINDGLADVDTIIKGDTDASLFKVDAGLDAVGIGGAATSGYKLTVNGALKITSGFLVNADGGSNPMQIKGDTDDNLLYIDAASNSVGVGTDSPVAKLDVNGSFRCNSISNDTGLAAGTYAPTCTGVANVDSTSAVADFTYMRVGNSVLVSGNINIDATAATTLTRVRVSLPVASDLTNAGDLTGTGGVQGSDDVVIAIGDITNDAAEINYTANGTANTVIRILFMYVVK